MSKVSQNVSIRILKFFDVLQEFRIKLTPFYETNPRKFQFYKISRCLSRSKSVAHAWPYHESHRWLTHHHSRWVPTMRATSGLTHHLSGGGPLPWGSPVAHAPSFRRWAPTMRATSGLTYLHSEGGPLTWEPPVAHAPSFGRWTPTIRATSGLTHRLLGGGPLPWGPPVAHAPSFRRWAPTMRATGGLSSQAETNGAANKAQWY